MSDETSILVSDFLDFNFGKLHYQQLMTDKEVTILLLHAFHSSTNSYIQICDLLKDKFNVASFDLPGHGLSAHVDCEKEAWYYSMEGFTAVLIEFIERMNLKNLIIVGDSVGGNCAVRALSSLQNVKGLVLMGSAQAATVDDVFALHHQSEALNLLFQKELTPQQCELLAAAYVNPDRDGGRAFQLMVRDIQRTDPHCREYFARSMETQKWVNELKIIQNSTVPLIYILGEDDGFINSPYYKQVLIEAGLQESQIHLLKQVRHVPQLDNPEMCARIILDFVKTLP